MNEYFKVGFEKVANTDSNLKKIQAYAKKKAKTDPRYRGVLEEDKNPYKTMSAMGIDDPKLSHRHYSKLEKVARGARIATEFRDYLGDADKELTKEYDKGYERKNKKLTKKLRPHFNKWLAASDKKKSDEEMAKWKEKKDKPKNSVKSGLKAGATLGSVGAVAGGGAAGLLSSPLRLLGKKGKLAANIITGAGAGAVGAVGAKGGYDMGRKNFYYGMSKKRVKEGIKNDRNSAYVSKIEELGS